MAVHWLARHRGHCRSHSHRYQGLHSKGCPDKQSEARFQHCHYRPYLDIGTELLCELHVLHFYVPQLHLLFCVK